MHALAAVNTPLRIADPLWIQDVDGWVDSGGDLSDHVVSDAGWSPFDRLDDVEGVEIFHYKYCIYL